MAAGHNTLTYEGRTIHEVLCRSCTTEFEHVKQLLEQGERPCRECFLLAARIRNFPIVSKLLDVDPSGINTKDEDGQSFLSYFTWNIEYVLKLLKKAANQNQTISDIANILERVNISAIKYSDTDEDIIEILKFLSSAVKIDTINGVPLLKLLATKPKVFNEALELGVNPNIPEIHDIMTTLLLLPTLKFDYPIIVEIFTKLSNMGINLVGDKNDITLLKSCPDRFTFVTSLIKIGAPLVPYLLKKLVSQRYLTFKKAVDLHKILETVVNNGLELVDEEGCSLVKHCNNEDMLLHLLRLGADPHVPEIHKLLGTYTYRYTEKFKEIYSIVAAAGVKLVDERNRSLIKYSYNPDNICCLLKLGAAPFHEGENLLKNAFNSDIDPITALESYIESGFNVMEKDKNGCTFLCTAIVICARRERSNYESLELVRYMLTYPDISDENFQLSCESGYHPQEIVIQHCSSLHDSKLVNMVFGSKFKDPIRLLMNIMLNEYSMHKNTSAPVDMSLMSYYINSKNSYRDAEDMLKDVDYLRQQGFSVNGPGVSPLTVALAGHMHPKTSFEFFVQRGVNVEQRVVQYEDPVLQDWKESLKVPDAAVMAAFTGSLLDILQVLAPHLAFPPLALLLFKRIFWRNQEKLEWFSALLREGRVPHGTRAYQAIRDKVRKMSDVENNPPTQLLPIELEIPEHIGGIDCQQLTMFDVAHRSPLSLLELSRVAVLMQLADTAAGSDTQSLAKLFTSLLPPGLNDQMIRDKIAQMREAEDKWLPDELQLLEKPSSLRFVNCVLGLPDEDPISSDSENSDISGASEYDDYGHDDIF